MTQQEKLYFDKLVKNREGFAAYLKLPDFSGLRAMLANQFADQAHFVYELLQNADDAEATYAKFILSNDKLIFKHNGKPFTITDIDNESDENHGDINAITAIAFSNKNKDANEPVNKIGKFGIGFKAILQYTDTPLIFDENFSFRIKELVVPELLNYDHKERDDGETLFEFPFDEKYCPPDKAYREISEKLKALDCPLLFLSNLKEIELSFGNIKGIYRKDLKSARKFGDTTAELLTLIKNFDDKTTEEKLWLFSRESEGGRKYCVGYFLDEKNHLKPVVKPAFCFFPTKQNTNLNFIIHALFYLNGSREGIKAGNDHNINMIELLAKLAADSLI